MIGLLLDCETTGLKEPQYIEIAYLPLQRNLTLATDSSFHRRYKPSKPIEFGAQATHHICMEDLLACDATGSFRLPVATHYLVGHNIDFDWEALGRPVVSRICTLALAREAYPQLDSHSLGALMYAMLGVKARESVQQGHRALQDVWMNYQLLMELSKRLSFSSLEEAFTRSEEARIPKIMPFGKHKGIPIQDVPYNYITWCFKQPEMDPYVLQAFRRRLAR